MILSFGADLDDVLYLESARRGDLIIGPAGETQQGDPEDVAAARVDGPIEYEAGFQSMVNLALNSVDSVKFIKRVIREIS